MESVQGYNWKVEHIRSGKNRVCDALSRLCRDVAGYSRYYPNSPPRLLNLSKRLAKHTKQLVQEMAEVASLDESYLLMLADIENKVEMTDLSADSELRAYSGCKDNISVA